MPGIPPPPSQSSSRIIRILPQHSPLSAPTALGEGSDPAHLRSTFLHPHRITSAFALASSYGHCKAQLEKPAPLSALDSFASHRWTTGLRGRGGARTGQVPPTSLSAAPTLRAQKYTHANTACSGAACGQVCMPWAWEASPAARVCPRMQIPGPATDVPQGLLCPDVSLVGTDQPRAEVGALEGTRWVEIWGWRWSPRPPHTRAHAAREGGCRS